MAHEDHDHILESIGLYDNERLLVGALLRSKRPLRASEAATAAKLPRQTAYSILANLTHRGLLVETDRNGVKHFYTDMKEIARFIDLERSRLGKVRDSMRLGSGYALKDTPRSDMPSVQFYEGALGLRKLFESILELHKKGKVKQFRGYGINQFKDSPALREYLSHFVRMRGSYGVKTKLFIGQGADDFKITGEASAQGRSVKHIDIEPQLGAAYFVGDRVYLFSYRDNVGVMIENQAIATMLKDAFDDHWKRVSD
jgi:predicted DNA-binding transcriptional regulator